MAQASLRHRARSGTARAAMKAPMATHSQPRPAPDDQHGAGGDGEHGGGAGHGARARKRRSPAPMSRPSSANTSAVQRLERGDRQQHEGGEVGDGGGRR